MKIVSLLFFNVRCGKTAEETHMEAHDVREALLLSALFAKRVVSLLREGKAADALEDVERVASLTAELTSFICSQEEVRI